MTKIFENIFLTIRYTANAVKHFNLKLKITRNLKYKKINDFDVLKKLIKEKNKSKNNSKGNNKSKGNKNKKKISKMEVVLKFKKKKREKKRN